MSVKAWSDEQENELISLYTKDDIKDVHELAKHFEKGYRSVISKLVQLKIYVKPELEEENKQLKAQVDFLKEQLAYKTFGKPLDLEEEE